MTPPVHSLDKTLLAFALLYFVLLEQGFLNPEAVLSATKLDYVSITLLYFA